MQVYAEYAFAENFCMDFALLVCAKRVVKNPCGYARIAFSSSLGAAFAVVYPLFSADGIWGVIIKLAAGVVLCALAGRFSRFSAFIKYCAVFAAICALVGGAIIGAFTLTGWEYSSGGGYLLSSVPVGIPLFVVVILCIAVGKVRAKFLSKHALLAVKCRIYCGERQEECDAFFDSGNRVYFRGEPVCAIDKTTAEKLCDINGIKSFVDIHTVAGKGKMPLLRADKVEIDDGKRLTVRRGVLFGVSPSRIKRTVLHPDLSEDS